MGLQISPPRSSLGPKGRVDFFTSYGPCPVRATPVAPRRSHHASWISLACSRLMQLQMATEQQSKAHPRTTKVHVLPVPAIHLVSRASASLDASSTPDARYLTLSHIRSHLLQPWCICQIDPADKGY
ncbi:hypothetical protein E4U21_003641 [Claviceps maximensis]|nr:hypothetical protein E4U21_003641 [Claviceps maximensis]